MTLFKWSKTAANNASADSTINWAEGQAPSSINDSARSTMAAVAKYRDDISGAIVTSGSATAYTVASNQGFDTLANLAGAMIAFTPHATNTAAATLNVDSLGAKPLRFSPGVDIPSGSLILGTPYVATYNNTDGSFYLQGGFINPYAVPLAGGMDYWADTAPNSAFAFPSGQAVSRTIYAPLFDRIGTKFGSGDGSTTFNLPDKRGRVSAGKDDMGGSAASRLTVALSGINGSASGSVGGQEVVVLINAQIPLHSHSGTTGGMNANNPHAHTAYIPNYASGSFTSGSFPSIVSAPGGTFGVTVNSTDINHGHDFTTNNGNGLGGSHHLNVQPTIVCNYIMRVT